MDLKEKDILGADIADHWYYRSKAKAMMRLLDAYIPSKILDVGAGSGFFTRHLLAHTSAEEAWCVDRSYVEDSDTINSDKLIHYRRSIKLVDVDLVLFMDVLEHVNDDIELLTEYSDKVPRGSQFLISVPAFQFLWSGHDDFLDHKRRYTRHQLENVVASAGLTVKHSSYYFGIVFPIVTAIRLAQKWRRNGDGTANSQLTRHPPFINKTLATLCQCELSFMRINRFAGLTVFCLAESK